MFQAGNKSSFQSAERSRTPKNYFRSRLRYRITSGVKSTTGYVANYEFSGGGSNSRFMWFCRVHVLRIDRGISALAVLIFNMPGAIFHSFFSAIYNDLRIVAA